MDKTKPKKTELAQFKALSDLGLSNNAIAKRTGRDNKTVKKYLESDAYNDPDIQEMVNRIKEKELSDLYLLGAKARHRLHELLDEGKTKAIETTAIMDRTFQQRRLLENQSTQNISTRDLIVHLNQEIKDARAELKKLEDEEDD